MSQHAVMALLHTSSGVASGGTSGQQEHKGHIMKLAARFGVTVAPGKRFAMLRKSHSAGQSSCQDQVCPLNVCCHC